MTRGSRLSPDLQTMGKISCEILRNESIVEFMHFSSHYLCSYSTSLLNPKPFVLHLFPTAISFLLLRIRTKMKTLQTIFVYYSTQAFYIAVKSQISLPPSLL